MTLHSQPVKGIHPFGLIDISISSYTVLLLTRFLGLHPTGSHENAQQNQGKKDQKKITVKGVTKKNKGQDKYMPD